MSTVAVAAVVSTAVVSSLLGGVCIAVLDVVAFVAGVVLVALVAVALVVVDACAELASSLPRSCFGYLPTRVVPCGGERPP